MGLFIRVLWTSDGRPTDTRIMTIAPKEIKQNNDRKNKAANRHANEQLHYRSQTLQDALRLQEVRETSQLSAECSCQWPSQTVHGKTDYHVPARHRDESNTWRNHPNLDFGSVSVIQQSAWRTSQPLEAGVNLLINGWWRERGLTPKIACRPTFPENKYQFSEKFSRLVLCFEKKIGNKVTVANTCHIYNLFWISNALRIQPVANI